MIKAFTRGAVVRAERFLPGLARTELVTRLDDVVRHVSAFRGTLDKGVLLVPSAVLHGETVSAFGRTFEAQVIGTPTGSLTVNNELNNTNVGLVSVTITAHGLAVGDLIAVGLEIMKVVEVVDVDTVRVSRGHSGTTITAHADGLSIDKAATPAAGSNIEVGGFSPFSGSDFASALVAVINAREAGSLRAVAPTPTTVVVWNKSDDRAGKAATAASALSHTLSGAGNGWTDVAATGRPGNQVAVHLGTEVVSAAEAADGNLYFVAASSVDILAGDYVQVSVSRGGQPIYWGGTVTTTAAQKSTVIQLSNTGTNDFVAGDIVTVMAFGIADIAEGDTP